MKLAILLLATGLLSWLLTLLMERTVSRLGWHSLPKARSSHHTPTPQGGGLAIVISVTLVGGLLSLSHPMSQIAGILLLGVPLAWMGLWDDVRELSVSLRLLLQVILCAIMLVIVGNIPPLELFAGIALSGWFFFAFLIFAGVWWINLFNFMDGIDGFAGLQAVFMLTLAAALIACGHPEAMLNPIWILMLCVAVATLGFLGCNLPPARIFMGDVGSTWLPFLIFAFALISVQAAWMSYAAWLVISAVFVTDATVTLLIRMMRGQKWFQPHCSHAYQHLARRWTNRSLSHRRVDALVTTINIFWLAPLAIASLLWPEWSLVWLMLAYGPLMMGVMALRAGRSAPGWQTST